MKLARRSLKTDLGIFSRQLILVALGFSSGCNQSNAPHPPLATRSPTAAQRFSPPIESLVLTTLNYWHDHERESTHTYGLDPSDTRISSSLRHKVATLLPPVTEPDPQLHFLVTIEDVVFPEPNFAYIDYRVGNRYDVREFADVFKQVDGQWVLQDHLIIAQGLMATALLDFKWKQYQTMKAKGGEYPSDLK
jgi:hypothetical protein